MSAAQTPVLQVSVDGREVTVKFTLPFVAGDECITPYHYEKTTVNRIPDMSIDLQENLKRVRINCHGAWYTASHSQLHGLGQFLPTMEDFLDYWLTQDREYFEGRIKDLERLFKEQPKALARIKARHVELLQAEVTAEKAALGNSIVLSTQKVTQLECAIAKATGATS